MQLIIKLALSELKLPAFSFIILLTNLFGIFRKHLVQAKCASVNKMNQTDDKNKTNTPVTVSCTIQLLH